MIIKEYFLNSSIHGFKFLADRKYHLSERLFWLICIACSWIGSYMLINNVWEQFHSQTSTLSTDTTYLDWHTTFPTLIFCDKGSTERFHQFKAHPAYQHIKLLFQSVIFYHGSVAANFDCKTDKPSPVCEFNNFSTYLEQTRVKCSEIFTSCYYNNQEFTCCNSFRFIESCYGTCFAINSYVTDEKLPYKISRNIINGYTNMSIEVKYDHLQIATISPESVPSLTDSKKSILGSANQDIKTDRNYDIYLSVTEVVSEKSAEFLEPKQRGCRFTYENNLDHAKMYSFSACINECHIKTQKTFCNCSVHTYPLKDRKDECDGIGISCIQNKQKLIKEYLGANCYCENSCTFSEIKKIGEIKYRVDKFRNPQSIIRFNFIVHAPSVRYIRQVVRKDLDLIVSIAGTLGLFVGASLLTIFEIFYYFTVRPPINLMINEKKNKKNLNKIQKSQFPFIN